MKIENMLGLALVLPPTAVLIALSMMFSAVTHSPLFP